MPSLCQNLKTSYNHLTKLTAEFTAKYHAVKDAGDLEEVKALRKSLEQARDALLEHLSFFIVPNARNPYHEALLEAGLKPAKTKERQETRLDLRKEIERQVSVYKVVQNKKGRPLLRDWVKDIVDNEALIYTEVAKDRAKIIERIKEGMVPIVMPGRSVQERTWEDAFKYLQPTWIEKGAKKDLKINAVDRRYKTDSTKKMTRDGFFKHIPDRPYLVWTKPTQGLDPLTLNTSFEDQQALYAKMVADDTRGLYDATDLIPTEYVALQTMATSQIRDRFKELQGGTKEPTTIKPLDTDTYTRFLSTGLFSFGHTPNMCFSFGFHQIDIISGLPVADDGIGFRPAARS
jgi:hypothetical protein